MTMKTSMAALAALLLLTVPATPAFAQGAAASLPALGKTAPAAQSAAPPIPEQPPKIEPQALAILKAMSDRLAAAPTMRFIAHTSYEHFASNGQPLVYMTVSNVAMRRPDRLRVITPGDGQETEFFYDGKKMLAYVPAADTVAIGPAPPTIDAMAKQAYDKAAIYSRSST